MKEIVLIGYYQQNESLSRFIASTQHEFNIPVRYVCMHANKHCMAG